MLVPTLRISRSPHGGDEVPSRRDRIGLDQARFHPIGGGEHLDEGLLDEILGNSFLRHAGEDDPSNHRQKRRDIDVVNVGPSSVELRVGHARQTTRNGPT